MKIRLLLIEDDERRHARFHEWLPEGFHLVWAQNAGTALGILERTQPGDFAGVLLDHDLHQRTVTQDGAHFNGGHVVGALLQCRDKEMSILVHSMNLAGGPAMAQRLEGAGYDVTRIPMADLTRERFLEWVEEVRENYEAR